MADALSSITNMLGLGSIFFWINKITALFIIWWMGGKFSSKFESKLPRIAGFVVRILSGIAMYWVGVIIGAKYFSSIPFGIGDFIGTIAAFIVFFVVAELLTYGLKSKEVSRKEFEKISKLVDRLDAIVSRLVEAATTKGLLPDAVSEREARTLAKQVMSDKGFEEFDVLTAVKDEENWLVTIKCKVRTFELFLDEKTSELVNFRHSVDTPKNMVLSVGDYVVNHKLSLVGVIFLLLFVSFISGMTTAESEQRFKELTSLEYEEPESEGGFADILSGMSEGGLGGLPINIGDLSDEQKQALLEGGSDLGAAFDELSDEQKQDILNAILQETIG